jgi:hypothetical protein
MYIGRIVIDNILDSEKKLIPKDFELVSFDNYMVSETPTLLVGYEKTKTILDKISILNKKINDNLYWTFSPREKRGIFEQDLKHFIDNVNKGFFNKIEFINIDPLIYKIKTTERLIIRLKEFQGSSAYLYGDKLYFYHNNKIYHLDFTLLDFIGFDTDEIKNYFINNFQMIEVDNITKSIDLKYIPYLYHKDANKNDSISDVHQT